MKAYILAAMLAVATVSAATAETPPIMAMGHPAEVTPGATVPTRKARPVQARRTSTITLGHALAGPPEMPFVALQPFGIAEARQYQQEQRIMRQKKVEKPPLIYP